MLGLPERNFNQSSESPRVSQTDTRTRTHAMNTKAAFVLLAFALPLARALLTQQESDLLDMVTYFEPSKGRLAMGGRSFTDGIINLAIDIGNGGFNDETCQSALTLVAADYHTFCSQAGSQNSANTGRVVDNWIFPLCEIPECASLASKYAESLASSVSPWLLLIDSLVHQPE